jgi:hypothetical protein
MTQLENLVARITPLNNSVADFDFRLGFGLYGRAVALLYLGKLAKATEMQRADYL